MDSNRTIQSIDAMPIKLYYRQYSKSEDEDKVEPIETVYRTTDTATLNYLKHHDPNIPYPINTVHLQNPYKHPLKFEGYATGEIFKVRPASFKNLLDNFLYISGLNSRLLHMVSISKVSQSCTEMLHLCKWNGNVTDCEKIFNPTLTDEGMCCNFNSVERKYLFYNPRDWSDINMTFPFNNSIDWNPETGYDEDVPPDSLPWRPYGAGQFYGLTLVLDVDMDEYYCSSTASVGFKMLLHNPVETPKIAEFAFTLTPGEETRVIVAPRISAASKSIINIPLKKRKCFFTSERKLRYYRTYTQRNCVLECEANFTQKNCHCVQYYMPKSSNTQICEKKDDRCATKARRAMEMKLYDDDIVIGSLNVSETPSCNCYPGCFEIGYNVEISQSKLVPTFIIPDAYVKKNKDYFAKNMAVVHLFFVDSQFTKYMKNELFGFTEFLSSTGGLLGLFMGFSFLSLVEIVYFVTLRLWCRVYKSRHAPRDSILHVQPFNSSTNLVYPFVQ